jgi:polyketide biosynthesis acyl carrier protein
MTRQDIFDLVVHHTREVLPDLENHAISPRDRLQDLGAHSMDRAEIINLVLESLRLRVPRIELFGPSNIEELVELLHARLTRREPTNVC